jgi:hypothetical protein
MDYEIPFDSIESAHEFVDLLSQVVLETRREVEADIQRDATSNVSRRLEALQIAAYKMHTLEFHLKKSRCLLNDLRTLRRLLVGKEPTPKLAAEPKAVTIARAAAAVSSVPPNGSRLKDDTALLGITG